MTVVSEMQVAAGKTAIKPARGVRGKGGVGVGWASIPVAGNCDGVVKQVAAGGSFQAGSALSGQQGPHSAEHPDGALQVHQLVVQGSPLCGLL